MTSGFPSGYANKTALLRQNGKWLKPHGTTPTTHILKTQIGELPNGLDLTDSVENEYYCLRPVAALGLPVNNAEIAKFGKTTALVIDRFDRRRRQMDVCCVCRRRTVAKHCHSLQPANT